jgi:Fic family protein
LAEINLRNLHSLVVKRSRRDIAGRYADLVRYVRTEKGRHSFPSAAEIPGLMGDFATWSKAAAYTPGGTPNTAFQAHLWVVNIHPFNDGNGRTARLLMNLMLIRGGYPPVAVRPVDRVQYIRALQESQAGLGASMFSALLYARLDATLDDYLQVLTNPQSPPL